MDPSSSILHAVAYLSNSQLSISEISTMVGYENPESFIRVFQKAYGISPSAYRKKQLDHMSKKD